MLGEIAFLPLEVLLVTLVIDRLLRYMERRNRLEKLNMVIGAFFVEVGTDLLAYLSDTDPEIEGMRTNPFDQTASVVVMEEGGKN